MRVLFLGTPEFAVPTLDALIRSSHTVVGVITQPDRAVKRGKTEPCAVKKLALASGLPVFQPLKIRDDAQALKGLGADIAVTAAYGQILTQAVLDAFPLGVVNVHASLLPKYRGASPIQSAIAAGELETGVTIMRTELGLDCGDILAAEKTAIAADETAGELTARLAEIGARLLVKTLDNFKSVVPVKQDDAQATHCKTIKKHEEYLDFSAGAQAVVNRIRALAPSPCAKAVICGETYKIGGATVCDGKGRVGEIVRCDKSLVIACGAGAVSVARIQAPSKRMLDISEFLRGIKFDVGVICGE